jgi:hypothetical protein
MHVRQRGSGDAEEPSPRASRVPWPDRWLFATWYAAFGVFALATGLLGGQQVQTSWGLWAAGGYALAAATAALWRSRGLDAALLISLAGALAGPLIWRETLPHALSSYGEGALSVVARSGRLLLEHGSPYLPAAQLAHPLSYDPYLPLMAAFGLPGALGLGGWAGNPRLWFGVVGVSVLALAFYLAGRRQALRNTAFAVASPIVALNLVGGRSDLPTLALLCLALAAASSPPGQARFGSDLWAAIAVGAACATKATAWPAVPVLAALFACRDGLRVAARFCAASVAVIVIGVVATAPAALATPSALFQNTVLYPLGLASHHTVAASPLPGHLLAATGAAGHLAAVGLLILVAVGLAWSLVVRPPADIQAATRRLALGLALMFLLAPASRWGYYAYPLGLLGWLALVDHARPGSSRSEHRDDVLGVDVG